jgi:lysophospholipase L1-like esterase
MNAIARWAPGSRVVYNLSVPKPSTSYVALGDSMSIDLYPESDARERLGCTETGMGAASLLFRNVDTIWPEFSGKDLRTRSPELQLQNLTTDGAMVDTVDEQLRKIALPETVSIATLTIGGNDLLDALGLAATGEAALLRESASIQRRFTGLVAHLRRALPNARLVLTTIYDPTDGTGLLWPNQDRVPLELLNQLNECIRAVAHATADAALADVNLHFRGHGIHIAEAEPWYWRHSAIEPSARGASEIRRTFWDALDAARR